MKTNEEIIKLLNDNGYILLHNNKHNIVYGYIPYKRDEYIQIILNKIDIVMTIEIYINKDNQYIINYNPKNTTIKQFNKELFKYSEKIGCDILPVYQRNLKLEELLAVIA